MLLKLLDLQLEKYYYVYLIFSIHFLDYLCVHNVVSFYFSIANSYFVIWPNVQFLSNVCNSTSHIKNYDQLILQLLIFYKSRKYYYAFLICFNCISDFLGLHIVVSLYFHVIDRYLIIYIYIILFLSANG